MATTGLDVCARIAAVAQSPVWQPELIRRHVVRSTALLRECARDIVRNASWTAPAFDLQAIRLVHGDRGQAGHALRVDPLGWGFALRETQVTRGLAHFLNIGDIVRRRRALLRAFGCNDGATDAELRDAMVAYEHRVAEGRRMDLVVLWSQRGVSHCVAVEAKLGHRISPRQLATYKREIVRRLRIDAPLLVVVAPRRGRMDDKELRRNPSWRFITWRNLMLKFERALGEQGGDADVEFARFRRTIWNL